MSVVSKTITITNKSFETIASLIETTLTSGKKYTIQVQNIAELKAGDAVFTVSDKNGIGTLEQGENDWYIRTIGASAIFTILENT